MSIQRKTNRFLLLMVLAAIGVSMVSVPSLIIKNYQFVSELGRFGTYLYLGTVGIGGAILLVLSFGILWKLWRGSARKRKRKELGNHDAIPAGVGKYSQRRCQQTNSRKFGKKPPLFSSTKR